MKLESTEKAKRAVEDQLKSERGRVVELEVQHVEGETRFFSNLSG